MEKEYSPNMQPVAKYYVYEWVRPDHNIVFNVGKGKGNRAWSMYNRNKHCRDVVGYLDKNGMKHEVRIIARFVNEQSAYDYEEERIAYFGLENLTNDLPGGRNGGGGMTGKKHKEETKIKIGLGNIGKVISLEQRRKLREANLGKKASDEARAKMSASRTGKPRPDLLGRKASDETRAKMSLVRIGKVSPNKGKKSSETTKAKLSKNTTGSGNPNAKIDEATALKIYNFEGKISNIASIFNVTYNMVWDIKNKKSWKHIHTGLL